MWVRGLKLWLSYCVLWAILVAPHVGAWIETISRACIPKVYPVAPHVGAWIETQVLAHFGVKPKSHPMWVRGLKRENIQYYFVPFRRTPCGCVD